jgi:hypothetical protein
MIEAGAILFVLVVSAGIYLSSWIAARQFSGANTADQLDVLRQHRETLRQKTVRGEREGWDSVMMHQLAERLEDVEIEIARKIAAR